MCSNCETTTAEYICDKCQENYCLECYQTTHAPRALQNHQKIFINKNVSGIPLCEIHTDVKLKYWCQKCHRSVCSDCLLIEHKDHPYNLINKAANELQTKVYIDIIIFYILK